MQIPANKSEVSRRSQEVVATLRRRKQIGSAITIAGILGFIVLIHSLHPDQHATNQYARNRQLEGGRARTSEPSPSPTTPSAIRTPSDIEGAGLEDSGVRVTGDRAEAPARLMDNPELQHLQALRQRAERAGDLQLLTEIETQIAVRVEQLRREAASR